MKKLFLILAVLLPLSLAAQKPERQYVEASDLTLIGKIHDNTPNPYHRVDTVKYKGFTNMENKQVRCGSGIIVSFKTDSPIITVKAEYGYQHKSAHTGIIAQRGFDLYIKKDGKWLWAGAASVEIGKPNSELTIVKNMEKSMKECLLYLPVYSEVLEMQIGTEKGSVIEGIPGPFTHRIGVFGSSYTQGISTGRPGMTWPAQFTRMTGLQILSLGCSGNSKLQPYFADVLHDADVDAFIFDSFSNPSIKQIEERLFPFIERIQEAHPGKPLIFLQTIYREGRNFDKGANKAESDRIACADRMMKAAMAKYPDVYYVKETNATSPDHEANIDGIHPSNEGYRLWAESIKKPVLNILKKYGITPKVVENPKYDFTEASDLTLVGKLMQTPNPYHRVDTVKYKGFTKGENEQVRSSSGIAVLFKTNSPKITIQTEYGYKSYGVNTGGFSLRGYDLYIKKDGNWLWAGSCCPSVGKEDQNITLVSDMDDSMKECLLYLPLYSEEHSVKIGTTKGSVIEPIETPFRHRIGVFGSSYTHGSCTSRSGMTWPAQFTRMTGIQMLSLGCSGNSKLQQYFADVFVDAENVDGFIFDSFSNPNPKQMEARLFPFIEKIQAAHPGKPLIFLQTIYREKRNFNLKADRDEKAKLEMADSLMQIAVEKYPDVYYVKSTNATSKNHEANLDGVHPTNDGYTLWAESIRKPVLKILKKYGIK